MQTHPYIYRYCEKYPIFTAKLSPYGENGAFCLFSLPIYFTTVRSVCQVFFSKLLKRAVYTALFHYIFSIFLMLSSTFSSISLYFSPFAFSSSTTFCGAFATKPALLSLPSTRLISPSSFFFSSFSRASSFDLSTSSSRGR